MKKHNIFWLLLLGANVANAQHGLNSIYSAFGIGDLETRDYSRNFGLSSTGIAARPVGYLNDLNPASYSAIPTQNFMLDLSLRAQSISYDGKNLNQTAGDLNFKRLAIGFKAAKWWGMSAGITPFSSVDYKILSKQYITGSGAAVTGTMTGTGGLNRAYISNGFRISKNFSAGVTTNFLFGPMDVSQSVGSDSIVTQRHSYTFKPNFTVGGQYQGKISDKWVLGLGATYRFQTKMKLQQKLNIINQDETVLFTEDRDPSWFTLPTEIGAGISLSNGALTWVADYRKQQWNGLNNKGTGYYYQDGERYSTGFEYALQKQYYNRSYEGMTFQVGFSYNKSPLVINNTPVTDKSGTLGFSVPSKNGALRYYIGLEAGQRGTSNNGLIKENYINAVFNFSLRDIWFIKRHYD
ncbi:hypothetical protein SAMN05444266_106382 [Chitinophaga jiangningensis]|uniref:Long-chain fatty acid transport protein n=1 Tax=Chitinophaga jiangningensis TaxID=1419482 RepID=A0A1M7G350_9BACT|nr:hypothetical protein [Chitinophaga jiangningensis]SHM10683.1 hypothetical protein SAMN05444266_106382 [Chitinophaga jiangningensis]